MKQLIYCLELLIHGTCIPVINLAIKLQIYTLFMEDHSVRTINVPFIVGAALRAFQLFQNYNT